jgi:hypothetical protein
LRVVRGLAVLRGVIYIVGRRTDNIRGYNGNPPHNLANEIGIKGMKWPRDMVSSEDECKLYVVDNYPQASCIWQIDMTSTNPVITKWIITGYEPWKLSGNSNHLVVTPWNGDALYVYNKAGELLQTVKMPRFSNARHGLETNRRTCIVGLTHGQDTDEQHDRVSEVRADGHVIRYHGDQRGSGPNQLSDPYHLALDARGRVLVADYNNQRVLLLNEQLQFELVLLDKKQTSLNREPRRLCYVQDLVGLTGGDVNVYEWR